jgi:hypothetical protein
MRSLIAQHTPGDWQQNGSHIYGPDPARVLICQVLYGGSYEEQCANARLILAAPKLLAALRTARTAVGVALDDTCGGPIQELLHQAAPIIAAAIAEAESREP